MKNLLRTIRNCITLKTFRHFKLLYNECDIEIRRFEGYDCAFFGWSLFITMGKFTDKKTFDTALLHEIGHYVDYKKQGGIDEFKRSSIKIREKRAWKYAIRLANDYDVELDYRSAQCWLNSYSTNYKVLDNIVEGLNESKR